MGKQKKKIRDISDNCSKLMDGETYLKDDGHDANFSTNIPKKSENEALSSKKSKKRKDKETHERLNYDKDYEFNTTAMGKGSKLETESTIEAPNTHIGHNEHDLSNSEDSHSNHKAGKKKKSKKKKKESDHTSMYNNINEDDSVLTVSLKKRKRSERSENSGHVNDSILDLGDSVIHVKKMEETEAEDGKVKKKKHKTKKSRKENEHSEDTAGVEDIPEVKPIKKKKKKKDEHNLSPKDSTDHFNLNSKKGTTLHESGKITSSESLNSIEKVSNTKDKPVAGQWGTNAFEDEAKQNKFLRLLGGFKQGADKTSIHQKMFDKNRSTNNSYKSSFGSSKFAGNMAMTKDQQEIYKKTMESEYESAMSMHLNRGIGLGFQSPQPAKKFSIDTQTSKSIKFDDSD